MILEIEHASKFYYCSKMIELEITDKYDAFTIRDLEIFQ